MLPALPPPDKATNSASLEMPKSIADLNGNWRHNKHRNRDEHTYRADNHRGERQRKDREAFAEFGNDGFGDAIGGTGLHHHTSQNAGSQHTHDGAHNALATRHNDAHRLGQRRSADQTSDNGPEQQRICGVEFFKNQHYGQCKAEQRRPPCNRNAFYHQNLL